MYKNVATLLAHLEKEHSTLQFYSAGTMYRCLLGPLLSTCFTVGFHVHAHVHVCMFMFMFACSPSCFHVHVHVGVHVHYVQIHIFQFCQVKRSDISFLS